MANERKQLSEKQIRRNFKMYEKKASQTLNQMKKEQQKGFMSITMIMFDVFVLVLIKTDAHKYALHGLFLFIFGYFVSVILSKHFVNKIFSGRLMQIECTEGYTQTYIDELYKTPENKIYGIAVTLSVIYNMLGNPAMALTELKKADETVYSQNPANGHSYYSSLLTAYLLSGDLDHAADAYNRGLYYMRTYMNSPISGCFVSLALGMYEYYCGHYETSLQLLDNAMRVHCANLSPESRIPDENMSTMICYWKAVNLASIGNKAAAWDSINYCKNFYKTPYYQQCCEKLLADMAEKHKSEMMENGQALP